MTGGGAMSGGRVGVGAIGLGAIELGGIGLGGIGRDEAALVSAATAGPCEPAAHCRTARAAAP